MPSAQNLPRPRALRLLDIVRWVLPLALGVVAWVFEWTEHLSAEHEPLTPGFYGEVLLFGVVGPVVVAIVLTWVRRLVITLQATTSALETMNRDLETIVVQRTANLQAATGELADRNRQLARANEELRELDRMKSDFVSLVSHQLRAPLTNINGALELVSQDANLLPAVSQRTLRILADEGHRLSHMIETILDVSRLEAGQLTPSAGPVALEPLLARVCASVVANEADRRDWKLEVTPELPPVWADETLLEEIVRNLVENAVRYSRPGQPIDVSARRAPGSVTISVADHGRASPPRSSATSSAPSSGWTRVKARRAGTDSGSTSRTGSSEHRAARSWLRAPSGRIASLPVPGSSSRSRSWRRCRRRII